MKNILSSRKKTKAVFDLLTLTELPGDPITFPSSTLCCVAVPHQSHASESDHVSGSRLRILPSTLGITRTINTYRETMKPDKKHVEACNPLIPGYTGYVPQRFYRIGTSYGDDSLACMISFYNATQRSKDTKDALRNIAATTPKLPSICPNEDVLQALYEYNYKHHPYVLGTVVTKRSLFEPPIPGWTGFVPRARVTELGHGVRYHEMAKHCYRDFKNLLDQVRYDPSSNLHEGKMHEVKVSKVPNTYQRFYRPEGMLPKYSGHIPHEHLIIGKTFGNLCRSCSVCTHTEQSYGAHLTKKRNATLKLQKNLQWNMKS